MHYREYLLKLLAILNVLNVLDRRWVILYMKILSDNTGLSFWSIRVLTDTVPFAFLVLLLKRWCGHLIENSCSWVVFFCVRANIITIYIVVFICVKYVKIRWFCVEKVRIEALKGKIFNFNENKENHRVYPSACDWIQIYAE